MLDEILEYQQYSFDINSPDDQVQRLKRSTLISFTKNNRLNTSTATFSGLNRALTIIARHFIYEVYDGDDDLKEKTINALKAWLGHRRPDESADAEVHRLYKWLPLYVEKIFLANSIDELNKALNSEALSEEASAELKAIICQLYSSDSQKERTTIAERLFEKCEQLNVISKNSQVHKSIKKAVAFLYQLSTRKSFNNSGYADYGEANTINAITYDRITGNARRAGRLKRYYLACDRLLIEDVKKETAKRNGSKKLINSDRDIIYKLTACCMMTLSKKGTREVQEDIAFTITEADFVNWLVAAKCENKKKYLYKEERIFENPREKKIKEDSKGTNTTWIKLNKKWLNDSGFKILIDDPDTDVIKEYLKAHPNGVVFVDKGAGVPMMEIKNQ